MDRIAIFKTLAADVAKGELAFPTSAQVAMKVRQALENPDCHVDAAAKLVQAEPLLSARVVAISNSAAFNSSGREISDVRTAVSRLGFATVRTLATALVTRQLAGAPTVEPYKSLTAQLWEHTAHVAALARVIAREVTHQNPDTAMFVGIIHEVEGFYLLSRAKDFPGILEGDMVEWIESGRPIVGEAVLKTLAVPDAIATSIKEYWEGFLALPPSSLADTLLMAESLAPVLSPLMRPREEGDAATPSVSSLDLSIGEETLSSILAEAANEMSSLTGALKF